MKNDELIIFGGLAALMLLFGRDKRDTTQKATSSAPDIATWVNLLPLETQRSIHTQTETTAIYAPPATVSNKFPVQTVLLGRGASTPDTVNAINAAANYAIQNNYGILNEEQATLSLQAAQSSFDEKYNISLGNFGKWAYGGLKSIIF